MAAVLDPDAVADLALLVAERDEDAVDAALLAADDELAEDRGQSPVARGVADVVLAVLVGRRRDRRTPAPPGRRWRVVCTRCTFEPWPDSLIAKAPGSSKVATSLEVALVVLAGAEVVDGAAEEPELDAALDEQREVGERERLEARDRRADHAEAAELLGEEQRRPAGLGQRRASTR